MHQQVSPIDELHSHSSSCYPLDLAQDMGLLSNWGQTQSNAEDDDKAPTVVEDFSV
ncbi:hypothetical protein Aoki45_01300 [Algoriphagus sp. oki45]|nr:hypothetical protein Aoki45_01300 [Algoriphagus sp. oki45]